MCGMCIVCSMCVYCTIRVYVCLCMYVFLFGIQICTCVVYLICVYAPCLHVTTGLKVWCVFILIKLVCVFI